MGAPEKSWRGWVPRRSKKEGEVDSPKMTRSISQIEPSSIGQIVTSSVSPIHPTHNPHSAHKISSKGLMSFISAGRRTSQAELREKHRVTTFDDESLVVSEFDDESGRGEGSEGGGESHEDFPTGRRRRRWLFGRGTATRSSESSISSSSPVQSFRGNSSLRRHSSRPTSPPPTSSFNASTGPPMPQFSAPILQADNDSLGLSNFEGMVAMPLRVNVDGPQGSEGRSEGEVQPRPRRGRRGSFTMEESNRHQAGSPRTLLEPTGKPASASELAAASEAVKLASMPRLRRLSLDCMPEPEDLLNKRFGYNKNLALKYDMQEEIGRGHFGYTCLAKVVAGERKGQPAAVKVISKAEMTTRDSIEHVKREVRILRSLSGQHAVVQFFDAFEDHENVYIAMECCGGGELLDRILERGGRFEERDAIPVLRQVLRVVAFCHQQGIAHRDLKPENFLFCTKDATSALRMIDFGLADYVKPDQRLVEIVGSAFYTAPEVLRQSYGLEADMWSVGVNAYILLSGSRPFWGYTESGILRAVLKMDPSFGDMPWPCMSGDAVDFVRKLLSKDPRRRPTAAQALTHPWLKSDEPLSIPLDCMAVYASVQSFCEHSELRKQALRAFANALPESELVYFRAQFAHLDPKGKGTVSFQDFKQALVKVATSAMEDSGGFSVLTKLSDGLTTEMDFLEFCAATVNILQYEVMPLWGPVAKAAFQSLQESNNPTVTRDQLAAELGGATPLPLDSVPAEWLEPNAPHLTFLGFHKVLHGPGKRARLNALAAPSSSGNGPNETTT
eukprot:TRINITY_DN1681_c0_g1_i1.p1 TRINITY_DN1681_c0_g1~~TRINITY_DN1681_c0_g1_i1.p1  ORF type:complete len:786 (-),score=115.42 TRINITY_DN1681_c0_g1_i1:2752-5109(-)